MPTLRELARARFSQVLVDVEGQLEVLNKHRQEIACAELAFALARACAHSRGAHVLSRPTFSLIDPLSISQMLTRTRQKEQPSHGSVLSHSSNLFGNLWESRFRSRSLSSRYFDDPDELTAPQQRFQRPARLRTKPEMPGWVAKKLITHCKR